jgi:transposase-like protein
MEYTADVKARMVRRMVGPSAVSARRLEEETGISQPTLSRWLREAASIRDVSRSKSPSTPPSTPSAPTPAPPKRPQDWTALERAKVVLEASRLSEEELGEFLRRQGLHREHLDAWVEALEEALARPPRRPGRSADAKRIKELEREVARKDKALAETTALLVLKKKLAALLGEEDDDTDERSDK